MPKGTLLAGFGLDCKPPLERQIPRVQPTKPREKTTPNACPVPSPQKDPMTQGDGDQGSVNQELVARGDGDQGFESQGNEAQGYEDPGSDNQENETQGYEDPESDNQENETQGFETQAYENQGDDTSFIEAQNTVYCPEDSVDPGST